MNASPRPAPSGIYMSQVAGGFGTEGLGFRGTIIRKAYALLHAHIA